MAQSTFEVASVRPNRLNDRIVTIDIGPGGRFYARGYSLGLLIQRAYGVLGWQLRGAPTWADVDRYDVEAHASVQGNLTEAQLQPMLQALLADRFKLIAHRDSKSFPGYELTVARGGPKLRGTNDGEHPETIRLGHTALRGTGVTMDELAKTLAGLLAMPVANKTAIAGTYDIGFQWTEPVPAPITEPSSGGSTIFSAIEDQFGLKLVPKAVTVPIIVIDHAEKASEN